MSIFDWWVSELQRLGHDMRARFPQKTRDNLHVIYVPDSAATEADGVFVTDDRESWKSLVEAATSNDGRNKTISILIPETMCLVRSSAYPNVSTSELSNIISLELATTTPFSAANAAWSWLRRDDGTMDVVIVKRAVIDQIRSLANEAGLILKDIRPSSADANSPPFETFDTPDKKRARFWRRTNIGLAAGLALLVSLIYGVSYFQKTAALKSLRSQIDASTTQARDLRTTLNQKEKAANAALRLQALKNDRTSVVETWARITQLLPTAAWVSELMLDKEGGTIVGFTGNAASLIELLERDPALQGVTFATAIRIDPISKAERFDIRFDHEAAK